MNPPTDPMQLLIYGIGTVLVVGALKLLDRRRDRKLQGAADSAASAATEASQHAADAAQHAAAVSGRMRETPASSKQAQAVLQNSDDTNRLLVQVVLKLSALQGDVRRIESLLPRVERIEHELDGILLDGPVRRRQQERI